jgi:simple sugar transport system substrate-binding protein
MRRSMLPTRSVASLGRIGAILIAAAVLATACGSSSTGSSSNLDTSGAPFKAQFGWGPFQLNTATAQKVKSGRTDFHFIMVGFATSASFYSAIRLGIADADKKFGVKTDLVGPTGFTTADEVSAFETAMQTPTDGILVQCPDAFTMVPLINQAAAKGIPVMTFNTDCPTADRFAWVGLSNVTAGAVAGTTFLHYFRQTHPAGQGPYQVAMMSGAPSAPFAVDRFNGFQSALASEKDISLIGPFTVNFDPSQGYNDVQNVFRGHPNLAGGFTADETLLSFGTYLDRNGLASKVTAVGFNLSAGIPELISKKTVTAAIGQYPYDQAYKPIQMLHDFLTGGSLPPCSACDVGSRVITVDNVAQFLNSPAAKQEG